MASKWDGKLNLDISQIVDLRLAVDENSNVTLNKRHHSHKLEREIPSWNQICALTDRIKDTAEYLNQMEFNPELYQGSAFDFYNFMAQALVMDNCISSLSRIFGVNTKSEDRSCEVFNQPGKNNKGSDRRYFEYLRALCSIHPGMTSDFEETYQRSDGECCPYVIWSSTPLREGDLIARVYLTDEEKTSVTISIYMDQVLEYVRRRYAIIGKIIKAVLEYKEQTIQALIETQMRTQDEFDDYFDYLEYLRKETETRFPDQSGYQITFVIRALKTKIADPENFEPYRKFCNALKFAVSLEHNRIQTMNTGSPAETGILNPDDPGDTVLNKLVHASCFSNDDVDCSYELSHLDCLLPVEDSEESEESSLDAEFVFNRILGKKDCLGRFVKLDENTGFEEMYVLVRINSYFMLLEQSPDFNAIIPQNDEYRMR